MRKERREKGRVRKYQPSECWFTALIKTSLNKNVQKCRKQFTGEHMTTSREMSELPRCFTCQTWRSNLTREQEKALEIHRTWSENPTASQGERCGISLNPNRNSRSGVNTYPVRSHGSILDAVSSSEAVQNLRVSHEQLWADEPVDIYTDGSNRQVPVSKQQPVLQHSQVKLRCQQAHCLEYYNSIGWTEIQWPTFHRLQLGKSCSSR